MATDYSAMRPLTGAPEAAPNYHTVAGIAGAFARLEARVQAVEAELARLKPQGETHDE